MICAHCQREFTPHRSVQRYCSSDCHRHAHNLRDWQKRQASLPEAVCPVCSESSHSVYGAKYCSTTCREEAWKRLARARHARHKALHPEKRVHPHGAGKPRSRRASMRYGLYLEALLRGIS